MQKQKKLLKELPDGSAPGIVYGLGKIQNKGKSKLKTAGVTPILSGKLKKPGKAGLQQKVNIMN